MIVIEFKTVCEIRIIHDYYLIDSSHRSFFDRSPEDQAIVLNRKLQAVQYDIRNDLQFIVSKQDAEKMRNFRIRLLETPLGFNLAIQVKAVAQGGETRYRPAVPLPDDFGLNLAIAVNNPRFGNITNVRLNEPDNLIYQFSNNGQREPGTLSRPIPRFDGTRAYSMGDLVRLDGVSQEALEDNIGDRTKWQRIPGNGLANEGDRVFDKTSNDYKDWKLAFATPPRYPLGALEVKFKTSGSNTSLLDTDGYLATRRAAPGQRPVAPKFELRLPSRRTYWRYLKKEGFDADEISYINDKASDFLAFSNQTFVTKQPRFSSRALTVFEGSLVTFPNPSPASFLKEGKRFFSDIYFNKVNPIPKQKN